MKELMQRFNGNVVGVPLLTVAEEDKIKLWERDFFHPNGTIYNPYITVPLFFLIAQGLPSIQSMNILVNSL